MASGSTRLRSRLPSEVAWVVTPDGHRVRLAGVDMVIGRQSDCDIVVPDDEVSRQHARVVTLGKAHGVIDLGSTNGTAVNGTRITGVTPLMHGDRIELGAIVLRYEGRVQ